ncbi:MAG: hypothetical protein M3022_17950 [Actinomycetota bacterium]|nr:hypothetical protein [Actinomycetota bacterium]
MAVPAPPEGLGPVPAGAVAVLAGVVPAPDVAVPGLADVTVVDELELLELLELVELLVTAALVSAPLTGTVKLGAPAVFVVPVPPLPQPATARARTTATIPAVAAGRCKR